MHSRPASSRAAVCSLAVLLLAAGCSDPAPLDPRLDAGRPACGASCGKGEVCVAERCYPQDCPAQACFADQVCVDGACAAADCVGVGCGADESCVRGNCYPRDCAGVECSAAEACVDGRCQPALCVGVSCPAGQECVKGGCLPTSCGASPCAEGEICLGGACRDRDCVGVACPDDRPCVAGACSRCTELEYAEEGACRPKRPLGEACGVPEACLSGHCVRGVCCDGACAGPCRRCAAGEGACQTQPAGFADPACGAFACAAGGACEVSCTGPAECQPDAECRSGSCEAARPLGAACGTGSECASAHCVDGVCCESACTLPCDACAQSGKVGRCVATAAGSVGDPACGGYRCDGSSALCPTVCASSAGCAATHFCKGDVCAPRLTEGQACASAGECASSHCADGVCCDAVCDGPCEGCAGVAPGTCAPLADGTGCGAGQVCRAGACVGAVAECDIGGKPYAAGALNPDNPCQRCDPAQSAGVWSNLADGAGCGAGQVCASARCQAGCWIAGGFVAGGATNPANPCEECAPATGTAAWSKKADGTGCGAGKVCEAGACVNATSFCEIGGKQYAAGAVNPANPCQQCTPGQSTTGWSNRPTTTVCREAAGACDVAEYCSGSPAQCPADGPAPVGTGCGSGRICDSSGSCQSACFIGAKYYPSGAANPLNACEACTPGSSTTGWTDRADGTSCGAAKICAAGTCSSGCYIGSTYHASGATNPLNACQACTPASSTSAWTNRPTSTICRESAGGCDVAETCTASGGCPADGYASAGTSCGAGRICDGAGGCGAGCYIGGKVYAIGAPNPLNACQQCTPGSSTSSWTDKADGTSCGNGPICYGGSCSSGCYIAGAFHAVGAVNPLNICQDCAPASSTSAWTNRSTSTVCRVARTCDLAEYCTAAGSCPADAFAPAGTPCASGQVCDGAGGCAAGCYIGGTLYASGTINPGNVCQACTPSSSTAAWTNRPTTTVCRSAYGDCDLAETCTAAGACPGESYQPTGTPCRAASGGCDKAEACTGYSRDCPGDAVQASGFVCRSAAAPCDKPETCNGSAKACPTDVNQPQGTSCRDDQNRPGQCSGDSELCFATGCDGCQHSNCGGAPCGGNTNCVCSGFVCEYLGGGPCPMR